MNLVKFFGSYVKVLCTDGRVLIGEVTEFFYGNENENGQQSIVLDCPSFDEEIELYEDDVEDIEIYSRI